MANNINWGKIYEKTAWGIGVVTNTISWGNIYSNLAGVLPSFSLNFNTIVNDFTFTRSSFATRVNEFGLIETVTDLGSDLVQNGSFDELSSELVVNGDFATDSDWGKLNSTISDGKGNLDGDGQTSFLYQDILTNGKTYKVTFTVSDYNSLGNSEIINSNGFSIFTISSDGTFTVYFTHSIADGNLYWRARNGAIYSIDDISVKQVDPNDYWSLDSGWSIGDDVASCDGTSNAAIYQNIGGVLDKVYKIELTISNYVSGTLQIGGSSRNLEASANGTFTHYRTWTSDPTLYLKSKTGDGFNGSIDNIIVEEVLEDDVPRIDYTGSTFDVPVLGSELITNGDFENGESNWSFGGDWTLVNGTAEILTSTNSFLIQSNVVDLSIKTYKMQYEVVSTNGSNFRLAGGLSAFGTITLDSATVGVKTVYLTSNGTSGNLQFNQNAFRGSIDNVSVKEVTAYTTTDKGAFLLEPISTNLITYSEDFSQSNWINSNISEEVSTVLSPNGETYSYKLTNNAVTGNHFLRDTITVTNGQTYTLSVFIKKGTKDIVSIADGYNVNILANFDLTNGTRTNVSATSSEIESYNNGWYKCSATLTTSSTNLGLMIFSGTTYAGKDESGYFYVWSAQIEQLPYSTSYIPTNGSTITRSAESCTKVNLSTDGLFGGKEGTIFLNTTDMATASTSLNSFTPFRLYRQVSDKYRFYYEPDAAFIGSSIDLSANGGELKMAFSVSDTEITIYVNGSLHIAYTIVNPILVDLDRWVWSTETKYKERVKDFRIYDKALTDEELTELTTI